MIYTVKTRFDIAFDKIVYVFPRQDLSKRGMTPPVGPKAVRQVTKLGFITGCQQRPHDFLHQFIRPNRYAERTSPPIFLRDIDTLDRRPFIPPTAKRLDKRIDFRHGHAICGFSCNALCGRTRASIQPPISAQKEIWIVKMSIQVLNGPAAIPDGFQYGFRDLHDALTKSRSDPVQSPCPCPHAGLRPAARAARMVLCRR